jgi:Spy/CpxP family protein refolding chaperone
MPMKQDFYKSHRKGHKGILIYLCIPSVLLLLSINVYAQPGPKQNKQEQIEKAKITYINKRLSLSPAQAEKFWPVYNDYNDQKMEVKRVMRKLKMETKDTTVSDEQLRQDIKTFMEYKQRLLTIEKESMDRYLKILQPRQAVDLIKAEREFIKLLYKRMEDNQ